MTFKDKLAFFQHLVQDNKKQEELQISTHQKHHDDINQRRIIAEKEKEEKMKREKDEKNTKEEEERQRKEEEEKRKNEEEKRKKEMQANLKKEEEKAKQQINNLLAIAESNKFLDPNEFPYFLIDKNTSITESNLQISDLFIEENRNNKNKRSLDVLQFNITLTNILNGKDELLKIRSILIIFVFKNSIDISPYFPTLLTEDILLADPKDELFSKNHKYFNSIFYNELKKHPLLMLNVIEVINEFVQIHSLQFESIYPIIAGIIHANEDCSSPLRINQMKFFDANKASEKYINQIIKNYPIILPLTIKYNEYLKRKNINIRYIISVDRNNLLNSVWSLIYLKEKQFRLEVIFKDEPGVDSDGNGLSKEFIQLVFSEILKKETELFELRNGFYWFKYHKDPSDELLKKYKCFGILLSSSIFNTISIPMRFPRYFYRKILNKGLTTSDLALFDHDLYKTIESIENDTFENYNKMEFVYSDKIDHYKVDLLTFRDVTKNEAFKPQFITKDNKQSFVLKVKEWVFNSSVKKTFKAFQEGFQRVLLNQSFLDWFSLDELGSVTSGSDDEIDWNDLKSATIYELPYSEKSEVIRWFWSYFDNLNEDDKRNVVKFITGTSVIPAGGLKSIQIRIVKSDRCLPTAHTCIKSLELPEYRTFEQLKEKCDLAFPYSEGYGFF